MENISNRSVENYWIELGIFTLSQISISIVLSILVIIIIFISRSEIKSIEFHTLILINVFTILSQLSNIYCTVSRMTIPNVFLNCNYLILNFIASGLDILSNVTLFYFSLLQISTLSRSKFVLTLFKLVNPTKSLVIYEIISTFLVTSTLLFYIDFIKSNCTNGNLMDLGLYFINIELVIPRVLIILGYVSATTYIIWTRLRKRRLKAYSSDLNELKRFKRNLHLMLKFLLLAIIFLVRYIPFILPNIITLSTFGNSLLLKIVYYSTQMVFRFEPVFIICVHNILRRTFLSYISNFFKAPGFKS